MTFPEGKAPTASDDEARLYKKWNQILYDSNGAKALTWMPEGSEPHFTDDPKRSLGKILALLQ